MRDGDSEFDLEPHEHGADEGEAEETESDEEEDTDEVEEDGTIDDVGAFTPICLISTKGEVEAETVACNVIAFIIADTSSSTACS